MKCLFFPHIPHHIPPLSSQTPLFIRFLEEMDSTGTFKHKKGDYKKEGFNPALVKEKMWYELYFATFF